MTLQQHQNRGRQIQIVRQFCHDLRDERQRLACIFLEGKQNIVFVARKQKLDKARKERAMRIEINPIQTNVLMPDEAEASSAGAQLARNSQVPILGVSQCRCENIGVSSEITSPVLAIAKVGSMP